MPFFTPGTMIKTPSGDRPVQELGTGDVVLNKKGVAVQIRWKGSLMLNSHELYGNSHLHPVVICKNAFGANQPSHDMAVSQNTWIDRDSCKSAGLMMDAAPRVAAKKLVDSHSIVQSDPDAVNLIHIHFDRHEVINANGVWVEAFSPLDSDNGMSRNAQRMELFSVFPELRDARENKNVSRKPIVIRELWNRLSAS